METKKITKREHYATLVELISDARAAGFVNYDFDDLTSFIANELELLDKKAASAKAREEKRRAEGDELRDAVQNVLTADAFMVVSDIHALVGNEEITPAKVVARLTQLVKAGVVVKEAMTVKAEDGKQRKLMGYRLA